MPVFCFFHVAVFHAEYFTCFFAFPGNTLVDRMVQPDCTLNGAIGYARTAEPAFVGICDDRRLTSFRVRQHDVAAADIDARIAADAFRFVKGNAFVWYSGIR